METQLVTSFVLPWIHVCNPISYFCMLTIKEKKKVEWTVASAGF